MSQGLLWDRTTRVIHWSLATALILNLFILEEGEKAHEWVGYIACVAVAVRFFWGFKGGRYSRFSSFPLAPAKVVEFIKALFRKPTVPAEGHNPLASYVYILIWTSVLSLGLTGWLMGTDRYWGEEWLEDLHAKISIFVQGLIAFHLLGLGHDSIRYKRRTWLSMFNGKQQLLTRKKH